MAPDRRGVLPAWPRRQCETPRHVPRIPCDQDTVEAGNGGGVSDRVSLLLRRPSQIPLVIGGALLDLLGLGVLAAYAVLALFGLFALAGLGQAVPTFAGDQTASLRAVLMPLAAALVELLEPLRAIPDGAG